MKALALFSVFASCALFAFAVLRFACQPIDDALSDDAYRDCFPTPDEIPLHDTPNTSEAK